MEQIKEASSVTTHLFIRGEGKMEKLVGNFPKIQDAFWALYESCPVYSVGKLSYVLRWEDVLCPKIEHGTLCREVVLWGTAPGNEAFPLQNSRQEAPGLFTFFQGSFLRRNWKPLTANVTETQESLISIVEIRAMQSEHDNYS